MRPQPRDPCTKCCPFDLEFSLIAMPSRAWGCWFGFLRIDPFLDAISNETSMAWCPSGWVPPPETGTAPRPPPEVLCPAVPCVFPNTTYETGGLWLFDIDADPTEQHDLSTRYPEVLSQLTARLNYFINLSIPQDRSTNDPRSDPEHFGGVWTPWAGDPNPASCSKPPPPPPPPPPPLPPSPTPCGGDGSVGDAELNIFNSTGKLGCQFRGWCSGPRFSGPPREFNVTVDDRVVGHGVADAHRTTAGAHGFSLPFDCAMIATGVHTVAAACKCSNGHGWQQIVTPNKAPACTQAPPLHQVPCSAMI